MEILFNRQDLVLFGKYLLSKRRRKIYEEHPYMGKQEIDKRLSTVNHADIENFLEENKKHFKN